MKIIPLDSELRAAANDPVLALPLVASLFGFAQARELSRGIWELGEFCGRRIFYAASRKRALLPLLESIPVALCIYGVAEEDVSLGACAKRARPLTEIVVRNPDTGTLELASHVRDEFVRSRGLCPRQKGIGLVSRMPFWCALIRDWYQEMRKSKRFGPPTIAWIVNWFRTQTIVQKRAIGCSESTIHRDLKILSNPPTGSEAEALSATFIFLWTQCSDENFVLYHSDESLTSLVKRTFSPKKGPPPDMLPPTDAYGRPAYRSAS